MQTKQHVKLKEKKNVNKKKVDFKYKKQMEDFNETGMREISITLYKQALSHTSAQEGMADTERWLIFCSPR